jgi:hypothetical protein
METSITSENLEKVTLDWKNSASVQRLLDVVSSILAEEYIAIAKQNPGVFIQKGAQR